MTIPFAGNPRALATVQRWPARDGEAHLIRSRETYED